MQALADARFDQQIDRALFKQARAHALFDIFPAARFENDGFDSLQVKQMSEHQSRRTCPDNADLRAHVFLSVSCSTGNSAVRFHGFHSSDDFATIYETAQAECLWY